MMRDTELALGSSDAYQITTRVSGRTRHRFLGAVKGKGMTRLCESVTENRGNKHTTTLPLWEEKVWAFQSNENTH